jgi:putative ABC transport system substrate-binding protein
VNEIWRRAAALVNPTNASSGLSFREMEAAAPYMGVQIHRFETRNANDLTKVFSAIVAERMEALVVVRDPVFVNRHPEIVALAAKARLPAMYGSESDTETGDLMSYGVDPLAMQRRAAIFVDKILKGAKPADLPIQQPTKFEFAINLKTAKQIGLTIPPQVLARADKVIK